MGQGKTRRQFIVECAAVAGMTRFTGWASAQTPTAVDVELVLAVDMSGSITPAEAEIQFKSYEAAFRDPEIQAAILGGPEKKIACCLFVWANSFQHMLRVPWTVLDSSEACHYFAGQISQISREHFGNSDTNIEAALRFAKTLFNGRYSSNRQVIDISGDGKSNEGRDPSGIRDELVDAGVTINGLPILSESGQRLDSFLPDKRPLDLYYSEQVIGGVGAFMVVAKSYDDFGRALRRKLVTEIAGRSISFG